MNALSVRKLLRIAFLAAIGGVAAWLAIMNLIAFDKQARFTRDRHVWRPCSRDSGGRVAPGWPLRWPRSNVALQLTAALRIAPAPRALLLGASAAELKR